LAFGTGRASVLPSPFLSKACELGSPHAHTVTLTAASGEKASTGFMLAPVATDVRTVVKQVITAILAWLFRH
jgi:hypothetical protein